MALPPAWLLYLYSFLRNHFFGSTITALAQSSVRISSFHNNIKDGSEMVKKENERLKKCNEELRKELEDFKKVEEKKVDELAGNMKMFVEKKDEMKDWTTIARRLNNGKMLDKVDSVFSKMDGLQNEVIKQVKVAKVDDMRSRRAIIFGLKESKDHSVKEQVNEIIELLIGNNVSRESISDVVRMRANRDNVEHVRPVIVTFKAEYDKWQFLKNKSDLKEKDKFRSVFLEIDMSREERAAKRERVMEKRRMGRERREVEQP